MQQGRLTIEHLPGANNPADLLTRALPRERFGSLSRLLGMRSSKTLFNTALPTKANEIGMLDAFGVVEPHCQHREKFLTCRRSSSASASSSWPWPKEGAGALPGAITKRYGGPSAAALAKEKQQRQWEFVQSIFRQAVELQFDCNILAQAVLRAQTLEELQNMLH